jgi:hypothetical protein
MTRRRAPGAKPLVHGGGTGDGTFSALFAVETNNGCNADAMYAEKAQKLRQSIDTLPT